MLVDTHCHLFNEYYDDIASVIKEANLNEIGTFISAGVDHKTNMEMIATSKRYEDVYIAIGIHPEDADSFSQDDIAFIENNLDNPKVVALGEIGHDYHYEGYNKEKQISLFEQQLFIAEKYNLPVVVHSRDATLDTINSLKKYNVNGVIHSFSGSLETAREYIKLGFKLGINGVVTFKNAHIKEVIKTLGIDNFVLETDSPYLTPEPNRGKTNSPANIKYIVNFLANYLNISEEEIKNKTNVNVLNTFKKIKNLK